MLGREELEIDLVLDHPAPIKTPGEWHRQSSKPLVPLPSSGGQPQGLPLHDRHVPR